MADLSELKAFDISATDLTVWVYKKQTVSGLPKFNGRWISITEDLEHALKNATFEAIQNITETIEYDILAQNNEGSALTVETDETYIALIEHQATDTTPRKKATKLKEIENTDFYVLRFVSPSGVLLAVRKTDATWRTKTASNILRLVFKDEELDLDINPSFSIQPYFDFFVFEDIVFISDKNRFESVLSYKAGHIEAFYGLTEEEEFFGLFSDVGPVKEYVGTNKIQLRRAIAIKEKGHYKNPTFIENLRTHSAAMNLSIAFDEAGKIIPTAETCRDIFLAFLDHRLDSRLSQFLYDVQSTEQVA